MQPTRLPKKKDVALALLEQATVFVHLDPRKGEVSVPPWLKRQPQLVLQVGLNMAVPIPDLEVDDAGLSCTLSFNRSPHHCLIPWGAVFALVGENGRGMVWPDDVPAEVAAEAEKQAKAAQQKARLSAAPAPAPAADAPARAKESTPRRQSKTKKAASASAKLAAAPKAEPKKQRAPRKRKGAPAVSPTPAPAPKVARSASATGSAGAPKRKRELPPYLRVVK